MIGRVQKTEEQMDDEAVVSFVRAFITVQAADWRRRQVNAVLPEVMKGIDAARAKGDLPDVRQILDKVWLDKGGPAGLLD